MKKQLLFLMIATFVQLDASMSRQRGRDPQGSGQPVSGKQGGGQQGGGNGPVTVAQMQAAVAADPQGAAAACAKVLDGMPQSTPNQTVLNYIMG